MTEENTAIAETQSRTIEEVTPPWGNANPMRGMNFHDVAMAFGHDYPIGTQLSVDAFDTWAASHNYYQHEVPANPERSSDAWLAHLQRRFQLRANLNKAATHPRMNTAVSRAYTVDNVSHQTLQVKSPEVALSTNNMAVRLQSLCGTKRRNLSYLMQSADWSQLPPHEQAVAESLYDDIDKFERDISSNSSWLTEKFTKLELKIRRAIESGKIVSQNGGFQKLLSDNTSD
tara:strand:+ start:938 stop:1627 length:690 start_codon:yes stop_codon:yes gene_type:complete